MRSFKTRVARVIRNSKLDFKEMTTVLTQIEACLNSHLLGTVPHNDNEVLPPGHFLIGHPLQALPHSFKSLGLLRRWYLCQGLVRHSWQRWRNTSSHSESIRSGSIRMTISRSELSSKTILIMSYWSVAQVIKTTLGAERSFVCSLCQD